MDNQENTNQADEPSLGEDVREPIQAREQEPAVQESTAQDTPAQEEEEAWWQKYVREEPEGTNAIEESAEPEAETVIAPPEVTEPEAPEPEVVIQDVSPENTAIDDAPEDLGPVSQDLGDGNQTAVYEPPLLTVELPPLPAPPETEEVTESLPPVPAPSKTLKMPTRVPAPKKIEAVPAAVLPPPPVWTQPERKVAPTSVPKSEPKPLGLDVPQKVEGSSVSSVQRDAGKSAPSSNSVFKLWPFAVGGLAIIFAIFFVPFTFVPDIVVEGKVEEEEQALLSEYSGKVETIFVQKWEKVQAGEPLIKLQSEELEEELEGLTTKLKMRYEGLFEEHQDQIARLNRIIVNAEIDYKALVSENEAIDRQVKNLDAYLTREKSDSDSGLVQKEGIAERQSVLSADYARNQSKITKLSGEIATAESDIKQLMGKVRDLQEKEFLDMADLEEENKYRMLLGKSDQLILKAPVTGSVSELKFKEGQSIVKGDTILRIVADPDRIKILIPEERIKVHSVGDFVWVKEGKKKAGFLRVPITVMSPKINSENASLESGRSVFVSYPTESALLPGQKVSVHLNDPAETGLQSVHRKITRRFEYAKRRE